MLCTHASDWDSIYRTLVIGLHVRLLCHLCLSIPWAQLSTRLIGSRQWVFNADVLTPSPGGRAAVVFKWSWRICSSLTWEECSEEMALMASPAADEAAEGVSLKRAWWTLSKSDLELEPEMQIGRPGSLGNHKMHCSKPTPTWQWKGAWLIIIERQRPNWDYPWWTGFVVHLHKGVAGLIINFDNEQLPNYWYTTFTLEKELRWLWLS